MKRLLPYFKRGAAYTVLLLFAALLLLGIPGRLSSLATLFLLSIMGMSGLFVVGCVIVVAYVTLCIYWWFIRKTN